MKLKIKRVDTSLPMPKYETGGSVAFDVYSREDLVVHPKKMALAPANLIICTPPGFMTLVAARSSLPIKKGLMLANGVGVLDQDYCGPDDELYLELYNFGDAPVDVKRGERLAQVIILKVEKVELEEVTDTAAPNRKGLGSTGGYHQ
ncbi:MAG: dUTP diphosphatase [Patescibacteria group bacterium]